MTKILSNKSNIDLDYPICRPSLDLDFTQERLDPRITFSRGSIGTRVNRNRLIETVSANQPRFDYDPVTGECKGLLIEESRSNLVTYSEDFSLWSVSNGSVQSNLITASDGNTTSDKIVENTSSVSHAIYYQITLPSTTSYTFSVFLKAGERTWADVRGYNATNGNQFIAKIDLVNGVFLSNTFGTVRLDKYPNGWYRFSGVGSFNNIYTQFFIQPIIRNNNASDTSYSGDGTSGLYLWGAQLEAGAFPTSYIPTTASTVTRSADNADMTGTNFSSWYNSSEGTLYASLNNITTRTSITFDRLVALVGTDVHRNVISICTQTASGGGAQNKFNAGVSYSPDGSYVVDTFTGVVSGSGPDRIGKAIITYKKDNFAFTVNGITPLRDIGGDIPVCNRLLIFGSARYQPSPSGHISRLTYYPKALKPNQLQYLTQ